MASAAAVHTGNRKPCKVEADFSEPGRATDGAAAAPEPRRSARLQENAASSTTQPTQRAPTQTNVKHDRDPPVSMAVQMMATHIILDVFRSSLLHPQLVTIIHNITAYEGGLTAAYFIEDHSGLLALMAAPSTPLALSADILDVIRLSALKGVVEPYPEERLEHKISAFYRFRRQKWLDCLEAAAEGDERPLRELPADERGPWPSEEEVAADRNHFHVHPIEYKPFAPLLCPCSGCIEERYPKASLKWRWERARAQAASNNEHGTGAKIPVPEAFFIHFPGSMAALDAECQALAAETARLRSAAVFLQEVRVDDSELLSLVLVFVSDYIERVQRGEASALEVSRLTSILPEQLWPVVQSAAEASSHRWTLGQNAPPCHLQEPDHAPAWSHIAGWMGLPSPIAIRWGVTATDSEPLLQGLATCESRVGPAYHYVTPQGDAIGDAHLAGPAYEVALAAVMSSGTGDDGMGAMPPASPAFVLEAGSAGQASPSLVYRYSARRMPLPTVLPLHMQQATSSVMAFGGALRMDSGEAAGAYGLPLRPRGGGSDAAAASTEAADAKAISSANAFAAQCGGIAWPIDGIKGLTRDHFTLLSGLPPPVRGEPWTAAETATMTAQQTLLVEEYHALCTQAITSVAHVVVMSVPLVLEKGDIIDHPMAAWWRELSTRSGGVSPPSRPASVSSLGGLKQAHAATSMMVILGLLPRDATGHFGGPGVGPNGPSAEGHPMWMKAAAPLGQPLGIYTAARVELEAEAQRRTAGAVPAGCVRLYRSIVLGGEADVPGNYVDVSSFAGLPDEPRFHVYAQGTDVHVASSAAGPLTHALTRVWDLTDGPRKAAWGTLHDRLSLPTRQLAFAFAGATKEQLPAYLPVLLANHGRVQVCLPECEDAGRKRAALAQKYRGRNAVPLNYTRDAPLLPYNVIQAAMVEGRTDGAGGCPSSPDVVMAGAGGDRECNLPHGALVTMSWSMQLAGIVCADAEAGGGLGMGPGHIAPDATGRAYAQQALIMRTPASFHLGAGLSLHSITRQAYGAEYSVRWDPYSPRAGLRVTLSEAYTDGTVRLTASTPGAVKWDPLDRCASSIICVPVPDAPACGVDGGARPFLSSAYILELAEKASFVHVSTLKQRLEKHTEAIAAGLRAGAEEVAAGKVPDFPRGQAAWPPKAAEAEQKGVEPVRSIDPREASSLLTGNVQLMKADGRRLRVAKAPLGWRELTIYNGGEGHLRGIWPAAFMYEPLAGPNVYQPWGTSLIYGTNNPTLFHRYHDTKHQEVEGGKIMPKHLLGVPAAFLPARAVVVRGAQLGPFERHMATLEEQWELADIKRTPSEETCNLPAGRAYREYTAGGPLTCAPDVVPPPRCGLVGGLFDAAPDVDVDLLGTCGPTGRDSKRIVAAQAERRAKQAAGTLAPDPVPLPEPTDPWLLQRLHGMPERREWLKDPLKGPKMSPEMSAIVRTYTPSKHVRFLTCAMGQSERESPVKRLLNLGLLASKMGLGLLSSTKTLAGEVKKMLPWATIAAYATGDVPLLHPQLPPGTLRAVLDVNWQTVPGMMAADIDAYIREHKLDQPLPTKAAKPAAGRGASGIADPHVDPVAWRAWMCLPGSHTPVRSAAGGGGGGGGGGGDNADEADTTSSSDEDSEDDNRAFPAADASSLSGSDDELSNGEEGGEEAQREEESASLPLHGALLSAGASALARASPLPAAAPAASPPKPSAAGRGRTPADRAGLVPARKGPAPSACAPAPASPPTSPKRGRAQPSRKAPSPPVELSRTGRPLRTAAKGAKAYVHEVEEEEEEGEGGGGGSKRRPLTLTSDSEDSDGVWGGGGGIGIGGEDEEEEEEEEEEDSDLDAFLVPVGEESDIEPEGEEVPRGATAGKGGPRARERAGQSSGAKKAPPRARSAAPAGAVGARAASAAPRKGGKGGGGACLVPGCLKTYASREGWCEEADGHMQRVHPEVLESEDYCHKCGRGLGGGAGTLADKRAKLRAHEAAHTAAVPCPTCGKEFTTKADMAKHVRSVHEGLRFVCTRMDGAGVVCGKVCTQSSNLATHVRKAHDGVRFECGEPGCNKEYTTKTMRDNHVEAAHKGRAWVCPVPGCGFRSRHRSDTTSHGQLDGPRSGRHCVKISISGAAEGELQFLEVYE